MTVNRQLPDWIQVRFEDGLTYGPFESVQMSLTQLEVVCPGRLTPTVLATVQGEGWVVSGNWIQPSSNVTIRHQNIIIEPWGA
jgi:hypothetical protein